jgi:hypothetical protein
MSQTLIQPFDSEASYRAAIDLTLAAARRELRIFDQDLADMGLDAPPRIAALTTFLGAGGRLSMVLHDIGFLEQRMPRFINLIRMYGHLLQVRRTAEHLRQVADCWVLADQAAGTIRFHADHPRGKLVLGAPAEVLPWWQRFDELWLAGEACSPGAATGL